MAISTVPTIGTQVPSRLNVSDQATNAVLQDLYNRLNQLQGVLSQHSSTINALVNKVNT